MDNDDEFLGFDEDSEIYKLLKLLKDSKEDYSSDDQHDNDEDLFGKPTETKRISKGDCDIIIDKWLLDDESEFKTIKVINNGDEELTEDKLNKLINSIDGFSDLEIEYGGESKDGTLTDLLDEAVNNEEFMLAAQIRDEIKIRKSIIDEKIKLVNDAMENKEFDLADNILAEIKNVRNREFKPLDELL